MVKRYEGMGVFRLFFDTDEYIDFIVSSYFNIKEYTTYHKEFKITKEELDKIKSENISSEWHKAKTNRPNGIKSKNISSEWHQIKTNFIRKASNQKKIVNSKKFIKSKKFVKSKRCVKNNCQKMCQKNSLENV